MWNFVGKCLFCFVVTGHLAMAEAAAAEPLEDLSGEHLSAARFAAAPNDGAPVKGTPIENELNRALRKSIDRMKRRPLSLGYDKGKNARITVTHNLSAPFDSKAKGAREAAFKALRQSLYESIVDECTILSQAFDKNCVFSSLSVRPGNSRQKLPYEVQLSATATYILSDTTNP